MGYRLVVGDTLPVTYTGGYYYYTSYLAAPGLLGFGEKAMDMPSEIDRDPKAGNGTGMSTLVTRRQFAMHPIGHDWKENTVTAQFPTNSELELAANWQRKFPERKMLPFVAIRSRNG